MRLVIADDEEMARFMIRSQIGDVGAGLDCRIVAEAKTARSSWPPSAHRPDVVIADIRMPVLGGLEALRASKGERAETDWIMLTGFSDFQYARDALRGGACEYLLKPVLSEELRATLERAAGRLRARKAAARRAVAEGLALQRLSGDRSAPFSTDEDLRLRIFLFDSVDSFAASAAADLVRSSLETAKGELSTFPCGEGTLICVSAEKTSRSPWTRS
jgi:two-component system response regulator YesN